MRYSVYVAAAVLVFFVAASVGAAAGLVAGWQLGPGATGSGGAMTTTEGGDRETTGDARASEDAVSEAAADEVSFILRTTDGNSRGDYTYIDDPSTNRHPNAIVLASPNSDQGGSEAAAYEHNIGVWYAGGAHKWAVFDQDRAPVPAGTSFEVVVPPESETFVHQATS